MTKTSDTVPQIDDRPLKLRDGLLIIPDERDGPVRTLRIVLGSRVLRIHGDDSGRILDLLDGSRSLDDLCTELEAYDAEDVASAVDALGRLALLEPDFDADMLGTTPDVLRRFAPQIRACCDVGASGTAIFSALRDGRSVVVGRDDFADAVTTALDRIGIGSVRSVSPDDLDGSDEDWPDADVAVVAVDSEDAQLLDDVNRRMLETGRPWLLVQTSGFRVRVGPFVWPHETACYTCYTRRIEANSMHYEDRLAVRQAIVERELGVPPADNRVPVLVSLTAQLAAVEVLKWFASRAAQLRPSLYGRFIDFSPLEMTGTTHRVLKLPRCPACGVRARGEPTVRAWMEPYDYRAAD